MPLLFRLDWAEVAQGGVLTCLVIPEQPREGFILGLTDGFETLAVETFYFQRSKQSPAGRVIPAVALAAHRSGDAAFHQQALNSWLAYWLPRSLWKIGPHFCRDYVA